MEPDSPTHQSLHLRLLLGGSNPNSTTEPFSEGVEAEDQLGFLSDLNLVDQASLELTDIQLSLLQCWDAMCHHAQPQDWFLQCWEARPGGLGPGSARL